jgi:hypothetical protein
MDPAPNSPAANANLAAELGIKMHHLVGLIDSDSGCSLPPNGMRGSIVAFKILKRNISKPKLIQLQNQTENYARMQRIVQCHTVMLSLEARAKRLRSIF